MAAEEGVDELGLCSMGVLGGRLLPSSAEVADSVAVLTLLLGRLRLCRETTGVNHHGKTTTQRKHEVSKYTVTTVIH